MPRKPSPCAAFAFAASALWTTYSAADWTEARCDIYPKGSDNLEKMIPCTFAQSQGHITITRRDGVTHDLRPAGDRPGNFRDPDGRLVYRQSGLGSAGLIFRFEDESVYVYWSTAALNPSDEDNPTAPFSTKDYDATTLLRCKVAGGYLPATAIARNGFLIDRPAGAEAVPREIKLWGFVDHGNLYGDAGAKEILREWWGGEGPDARSWRFNLKGDVNDAVGDSFPVHVLNDSGRDALLRLIVADARAGRPTKVFVTGKMFTFHAPTQTLDLTGLYLQLRSSQDIQLDPPDGD